jgi:hypothetical protein
MRTTPHPCRNIAWRWPGCALALALLSSPLLSESPPGGPASSEGRDDLEQNRELLEKWRSDPDHYARLRRDLRAFLALPPERQEAMRKLDRDLHEEDSATYGRLRRVLERYADWLERLPAADRQRIEAVKDGKEKLSLVRAMREEEWIARLPKATRDQVRSTPADQRRALIAELRRRERERAQEWQLAIKNWDELIQNRPQPSRLTEFPADVQNYVSKVLIPMLNQAEKDRLELAEGRWPLYPRTLVELADKHVPQLPGPNTGPTRFQDLPEDLRQRLSKTKNWPTPQITRVEGRWPSYAMAVTFFARKRKVEVPPLGPTELKDFPSPVRQFVNRRLWPALTDKEKEELTRSEGRWPDYPRTLRDLARRHDLTIPGMGLPGPRGTWDKFRPTPALAADAQPQVPDHVLYDFALNELTARERDDLRLSFADPSSKERLKGEWVKRHPKEWQKLQQSDYQKRQRKARLPE